MHSIDPLPVSSPDGGGSDILPAASEQAPSLQTHAFSFTGSGSEYFRIWIVNLFLSIVTLGVYSAWAKVRRQIGRAHV